MHAGIIARAVSSVCFIQMVLKDMGNGVTRIESFECFPINDPDYGFSGFLPLLFPLTPRVRDALDVARATFLAFDMEISQGRFRAVTSTLTEFVLW